MTQKYSELLSGLPDEVKTHIEHLDEYEWDDDITQFNILHMYPGGVCYPDGYHDSRFFDVTGYYFGPNNEATDTKKRRNLGRHDSLDMMQNADVGIVRIFVDGSTLIRFKKAVNIRHSYSQNMYVGDMQ